MTGRTADLGHDSGDRQVPQAHGLAGQELVRHQDHRLISVPRVTRSIGMPRRLACQVRADPQDHVADVGHPFPEVILLDPCELRGVAVHHGLKGRQRGQVLVLDEVVDLGQKGRIVDDLQVALEDLGLGFPQVLGDFLDQGLKVGRGLGDGPVELVDLGGNLAGVVQGLLFERAEDRLHAVCHAHHDARTHADSFMHDEPVSRFHDD